MFFDSVINSVIPVDFFRKIVYNTSNESCLAKF